MTVHWIGRSLLLETILCFHNVSLPHNISRGEKKAWIHFRVPATPQHFSWPVWDNSQSKEFKPSSWLPHRHQKQLLYVSVWFLPHNVKSLFLPSPRFSRTSPASSLLTPPWADPCNKAPSPLWTFQLASQQQKRKFAPTEAMPAHSQRCSGDQDEDPGSHLSSQLCRSHDPSPLWGQDKQAAKGGGASCAHLAHHTKPKRSAERPPRQHRRRHQAAVGCCNAPQVTELQVTLQNFCCLLCCQCLQGHQSITSAEVS